MPNLPLSQIIPPYPTHWTTILHYSLLLGTIVMLTTAGDRSSLAYTLILGALAVLVGADMYLNLAVLDRFVVFLLRVAIFAIPLILVGMAPDSTTRAVAVVLVLLTIPLIGLTFLTCYFGGPPLIDPRIVSWC